MSKGKKNALMEAFKKHTKKGVKNNADQEF